MPTKWETYETFSHDGATRVSVRDARNWEIVAHVVHHDPATARELANRIARLPAMEAALAEVRDKAEAAIR